MMKKLALALALCALCSACQASDSEVLVRCERAVAGLLDALDGDPAPGYADLKKDISAQLQIIWGGEKGYAAMREKAEADYGRLMSARFVAFERTLDADRVIYLGQFTKAREAFVAFTLDKQEGKVLAYLIEKHQPKPVVRPRFNWRVTQ